MEPLFQSFEFSYPECFAFYDRSGELACRLKEFLPALTRKPHEVDQRSFTNAAIDLYYGVIRSRVQSLDPGENFYQTAARFLTTVAEVLDLEQLTTFEFKIVLGQRCDSLKAASDLLWPLVPDDVKAKLASVAASAQWRSLGTEFIQGNFAIETRTAILELSPMASQVAQGLDRNQQYPYVTFHVSLRGLVPIAIAEFDAKAFMLNIIQTQSRELLAKLAPHLTQQ